MTFRRHGFLSSCLLLLLLLTAATPLTARDASAQSSEETLEQATLDDSLPVFAHKTVIIPHDSKKFRGGEDAAATDDQILVVADGVGGWARHNVNPGLYSRLLTKTVVELVIQNKTEPIGDSKQASLVDIVHQANWMAAKEHLGSATCTVVQLLDGGKTLNTLNVGDSGYSIHRYDVDNDFQVVYASTPGQKRFNFPHQLGGQHGDEVKDVAVEETHELQPKDIIVVYSDGVSDNLYPKDYHECLSEATKSNDEDDAISFVSLSWIADCIAKHAYELGKSKTFLSPFAQGAREAGRPGYVGGKHDDITVTVAQVVANSKVAAQLAKSDPYFDESIYLYTGDVASKDNLPDLSSSSSSKPKLVEAEL